MSHDPEEILSFWFGDALGSAEEVDARSTSVWFEQDAEFDAQISARFAALPALAGEGRLDAWQANPRSCLALRIDALRCMGGPRRR